MFGGQQYCFLIIEFEPHITSLCSYYVFIFSPSQKKKEKNNDVNTTKPTVHPFFWMIINYKSERRKEIRT